MDFNDFVPSETSDCVICHPVTGEETDIVITVYGVDSDRFRRILKEMQKSEDDAPTSDENIGHLVEMTAGWKNVQDGDVDLEFTPENVAMVYRKSGAIRSQVQRHILDVKRFFTKA